MPLIAVTSYAVELLSPVHVGTEERLRHHDVLVIRDTLYRISPDRLLAELESQPQLRDRYFTGGLTEIQQWLQQGDRLHRLAIYRCPVPRAPRRQEEVRPFLAEPLGRPYVPGTEIKGAIRTAVLWMRVGAAAEKAELLRKVGRRPNRRGEVEDERDRKYAGRWLEQALLGSDPKEDAFRLLRVADTETVPATALRVYPVLVAGRRSESLEVMELPRSGSRASRYGADPSAAVANFCEFLVDARMRTFVGLDRYLLSRWSRDVSFLEDWPSACNSLSRHVAGREQTWWMQTLSRAAPKLRPMAESLARFYRELLGRLAQVSRGEAIVNLGWGGGWRTKTVTEAFGEQVVSDVVRRYNRDRGSRSRSFPKTRKVAWLGGNQYAPLGWILLIPK